MEASHDSQKITIPMVGIIPVMEPPKSHHSFGIPIGPRGESHLISRFSDWNQKNVGPQTLPSGKLT